MEITLVIVFKTTGQTPPVSESDIVNQNTWAREIKAKKKVRNKKGSVSKTERMQVWKNETFFHGK